MLNTLERLSDFQSLAALSESDRMEAVELMRRMVCATVVEPIFVMGEDDHPNHVNVQQLSMDQLLTIWTSQPKDVQKDWDAAVAAEVPHAATFPDGESTPAGTAVPRSEGLRPEAEQLDDAVDLGTAVARFH